MPTSTPPGARTTLGDVLEVLDLADASGTRLWLDGGLASGALDADPDAAAWAARSARVLVDAAIARSHATSA